MNPLANRDDVNITPNSVYGEVAEADPDSALTPKCCPDNVEALLGMDHDDPFLQETHCRCDARMNIAIGNDIDVISPCGVSFLARCKK